MLNLRANQYGVTLIELMVAVAILGVLLALAMPMFSTMVQNSRIRASTEAIQNGLQLARAEAVRRNQQVRFQMTSTVDATCALSASGANWVVSVNGTASGDPTGACNSAPSDTVAPYIIQTYSSAEGSSNASITASMPVIAFNGFGRQVSVTNLDASVTTPAAATISVNGPATTTCAASGGTARCMQVRVSFAGQIRMCDPNLASSDPQGC